MVDAILAQLFVELHVDDIAKEYLRQGYFETLEGPLEVEARAATAKKLAIIWMPGCLLW